MRETTTKGARKGFPVATALRFMLLLTYQFVTESWLVMAVQSLSVNEAYRLVSRGETVFSVPVAGGQSVLFSDEDKAVLFADEQGARLLDWETGEYA